MLNCSASLAMSTSVLKNLPGKLDIKRHSPSIVCIFACVLMSVTNGVQLLFCDFGIRFKQRNLLYTPKKTSSGWLKLALTGWDRYLYLPVMS